MFSPAVHTCDELMWAFATVSHGSLCFCIHSALLSTLIAGADGRVCM
jgi:hypothetical protein